MQALRELTTVGAWRNWLGLARKAGKLAPGSHQVEMALKQGQVALIVIAEDAGASVDRKYHLWAQDLKVPVVRAGSKAELGLAIGMGPHAILAILDVALAKKLWMAMGKQIGGMEFGGKRQGQNSGVRTRQGNQAGQQTSHRPLASAQGREHQESHEHGRTRGGTNGTRHHARKASARTEGSAASGSNAARGATAAGVAAKAQRSPRNGSSKVRRPRGFGTENGSARSRKPTSGSKRPPQ